MNNQDISNNKKMDKRHYDPDYIYIDCFFYSFYIKKEDLKKYTYKNKDLIEYLKLDKQ